VRTQLETDEQKDSDLLFPSITGGFRTPRILNSPMADVATELGIEKKITPKALRRTFNDLARAAEVNDFVTRSISGHLHRADAAPLQHRQRVGAEGCPRQGHSLVRPRHPGQRRYRAPGRGAEGGAQPPERGAKQNGLSPEERNRPAIDGVTA